MKMLMQKLLEKRCGDPFVIGNALRDKLEKWPKIQTKHSSDLRRFSDFLKQCLTAISSVKGLSVLNDDRKNRKTLLQIPEWLFYKWTRLVAQRKEKEKEFLPLRGLCGCWKRNQKLRVIPLHHFIH